MEVLKCILDKTGRASTLLGNSELTQQLQTLNWNTSQERKDGEARLLGNCTWLLASTWGSVLAQDSELQNISYRPNV